MVCLTTNLPQWVYRISEPSYPWLCLGFLPPNFEEKFLERLCRSFKFPWRNVFSRCPRRSPPRPGAVGHVSTPQPKITCEKKQGVGIPRLLGLEWNLGVWLFFFGGCKNVHPKNRRSWLEDFRKPSLSKNGWTWQSCWCPFWSGYMTRSKVK